MKFCKAEQTVGVQEHGIPERRKIRAIPNQVEQLAIRHVRCSLVKFLELPDWVG